MSILPEAIKLENVRQRVIGQKPSMTTMDTQTKPATLQEFLSSPFPSLVQGALKYALKPPSVTTSEMQTETQVPKRRKPYDAGFMSILPQAIKLENVRQRAIGEKPSMTTMETQTEPLEVKVAKGQKLSVFELMKQQEQTGKTVSLTGAGRPFRENLETALAAAGAPAPAPAAPSPPQAEGSPE